MWQTTVRHKHCVRPSSCSTKFVPYSQCRTCWTRKHLPLRILCIANDLIDVGFRSRNGHGACIAGATNWQIDTVHNWSRWKPISIVTVLCVSCFFISVTKLWDMIMCMCMCKGHMGYAKVLGSKSSGWATNVLHIILPVSVNWEKLKLILRPHLVTRFISVMSYPS